jgi:hypothetical protein
MMSHTRHIGDLGFPDGSTDLSPVLPDGPVTKAKKCRYILLSGAEQVGSQDTGFGFTLG